MTATQREGCQPDRRWLRERPIIFSAPMVRALLARRKTQTRRIVTPQPRTNVVDAGVFASHDPNVHGVWNWLDSTQIEWASTVGDDFRCPYGVPGDRLWVRERHCFLDVVKSAMSKFPLGPQNNNEVGPNVWNVVVEYSDGTEHETSVEGDRPKVTRQRGELGWRSPIHMPRWASRITLELTDVRVERAQSISEEDAIAEGIYKIGGRWEAQDIVATPGSPIDAYRAVWNFVNGARAWDANPWVWVLTFERIGLEIANRG